MKTLAVVAHKGGVGKSTLSVHVANLAYLKGLRVGMIDLDPQKSALKWNLRRDEDKQLAVAACTEDELPAYLERAREAELDFVVIDTPPHANATAVTAAQMSDFTLVPSGTSVLQLETVADTVYMLKATRKPFAVVLNGVRQGWRLIDQARSILNDHEVMVLDNVIHNYVSLDYALIDGSSVHEFDPDSRAAEEIEALYNSITGLLGDMATPSKPKKTRKVAA
jgi:chromosome partitioning protein